MIRRICIALTTALSIGAAGAQAQQDVRETTPSRQNLNEPFELAFSQRNVNFQDSSLAGFGIGVGAHGRFLASDRVVLSFSATSDADITSGIVEGIFTAFFGVFFGFELDTPNRGDPDQDLMTAVLEYQFNDPSSKTALIALGGLARGDAVGGPRVDTFENSGLIGVGLDTRLARYAEARVRLRYVGIDGIGPDISAGFWTVGNVLAGVEYYYSDPLQSLNFEVGVRF